MRYRSKLFVPGNRPDLMAKAIATAADALSLDLEDAVPQDEKLAARDKVAAFARGAAGAGKILIARVNSLDTGLMIGDILAVAGSGIHVVNVPKCESARDLQVADALLLHVEREAGLPEGGIRLMPTIETPAGLRRAHEIGASSRRVMGLQLGTGDLKAATGLEPSTGRLGPVRTMIVLAAAECGVAALDSAFVHIDDRKGFAADAREARALGFSGKSCIHPSQVEDCNAAFSPSEKEIETARALIAAYDEAKSQGRGALTFRGQLVDAVHAQEARALLRLAGLA